MPWKMTVIYLQDFGLHFAILVWKIQGLKQLGYFHGFNTFLHIHRIKVPFFMWKCLLFQMRNNIRKDSVRSLQMGSYQIYADSFIFQRNYVCSNYAWVGTLVQECRINPNSVCFVSVNFIERSPFWIHYFLFFCWILCSVDRWTILHVF